MKIAALVAVALVVGAVGGAVLASGAREPAQCRVPPEQNERTLAPRSSAMASGSWGEIETRLRSKARFWSAVIGSAV